MGKGKAEELSSSIEDYLEAIGSLERENRVARVKDIAERLDVQMPSVTGALKVLRGKGLVNYERNSYITLTEEGLKIADSISLKHKRLAGRREGGLLPAQKQVAAAGFKAIQQRGSVTLVMATGTGKTATSLAIARLMQAERLSRS